MGKTVIADERLINILISVSDNPGTTAGLIIGQVSEKKDYVLHIAVTPKLGNELSVNDIQEIEDSWLKIHMKNVTRSLPGGIYVLGIFVVSANDIFSDKNSLQKVRSLITSLQNSTRTNIYLYGNNQQVATVVLHFCSKTKKYQCKKFSMQNMSLSVVPLTWKFIEQPVSWYQIDAQYTFGNLLPYLILKEKDLSLKKNIKDVLSKYKDSINDSFCLINGCFTNNSECSTLSDVENLLISKNKSKPKNKVKKEKKSNASKELNVFKAMLYEKDVSCDEEEQIEILKAKGVVESTGIILSRVFLNREATLEEAVNAVKEDILRSLATRLELHCDSIEDDILENNTTLHTPPRRILVEHSSGIMFSEYMFADDTKEDIVNSFKESLGIEVLPDSIVDFEPQTVIKDNLSVSAKFSKDVKAPLKQNMNPLNLYILGIIGSIVVLIVSLFLHYFK